MTPLDGRSAGGSRPWRPGTGSVRHGAVVVVMCGLLLGGCGAGPGAGAPGEALGVPGQPAGGATGPADPAPGTPSPTPTPTPTAVRTADLEGLWGAGDDGGAEILYEFDDDGTFTRVSLLQQKRGGGTFKFQDVVEGTFLLDGGRLALRPTTGTQTVDDPRTGDGPVSTRKTDLVRETHDVDLRDGGDVLVLTPQDGAALTLARQGS